MGSTPGYSQRPERNDTKTLVRLGTERGSDPLVLSKEQRDLLSDIARGDAGDGRVQLWFKGMAEPVRARMRLQGERIQLETSLTFLELDSKVGMARAQDNSARLEGRITSVSLVTSADQPVPRLCVDLALPGAESASQKDVTDGTSMPPVAIPPLAMRGRSVLPWTLAFVLGVAGGAVGSWGWFAKWLEHPFALLTQPPAYVSRALVERASASSNNAYDVAPAPAPELSADQLAALLVFPEGERESDPLAFDLSTPPALVTPVDATRDEFVLEREPPAESERAGDDQAGEATAEQAGDIAEPSPVADLAQGLEVQASPGLTEIIVPMQGSAEDLERYVLTTPGIALTLPHARALVPLENYAARRPLVRRVWLRPHPTGVQVRIIYPSASVHDEIRFDDRGLHVLLRP